MGQHEIKGSAFVTMREWVCEHRGEQTFSRLVDALEARHRDAVADPIASSWHPEELHQDVLRAYYATVADADFEQYRQTICRATQLGMHKFARVVLQMASPLFVLRRCPTMWALIRRGPARLTVEQDGHRTYLTYHDFPYFEDMLYRQYIRGLLEGIVKTTSQKVAPVCIVDPTPTKMVVEIALAP